MGESYPLIAVRTWIGWYILGQISRAQLEDWLFPIVWVENAEPEVVDLAWDAQLLLMEASGGYHTEEELRAQLLPLAAIHMGIPTFIEAFASSVTVTGKALLPVQHVGAPREVESSSQTSRQVQYRTSEVLLPAQRG